MNLMLLLLIPIFVLLLVTTYVMRDKDKDNGSKYLSLGILFILWFEILFISISFGQIKLTPHNNVKINMTDEIDKLLNCALHKIPSLTKSWNLLKDCVHTIEIYHVPKSKVPIGKNIPIAFVTPKVYPNDVFVVNSEYDFLHNTSKALVVLHECTHLVLKTVDHAYLWQPHFSRLTSTKHLENADSYINIIINNCISE